MYIFIYIFKYNYIYIYGIPDYTCLWPWSDWSTGWMFTNLRSYASHDVPMIYHDIPPPLVLDTYPMLSHHIMVTSPAAWRSRAASESPTSVRDQLCSWRRAGQKMKAPQPAKMTTVCGFWLAKYVIMFHWIGLREKLQETMVFTIKYRAFL